MQQKFSRALRVVFVTGAVLGVLAACGSEGGSAFIGGGEQDSGTSGSTQQPGPFGGTNPNPLDSGSAVNPTDCKPKSCADQGIECGPAGDGCGGIIEDCGSCGAGLRCGGPGTPSKCVSPNIGTACTPQDCASQGVECGQAGDGCGGTITCASCGPHQQCGATGMPSKCVDIVATGPGGTTCVPKTCADYKLENRDCGTQSDGCGATVDCGGCAAQLFCGGGGPSKCGDGNKPSCTPKTCAEVGAGKCGPQPDGCGGVTTSCGSCTLPAVCGGGGVDSVCGGGTTQGPDGGTCTPLTVAACGANQCGKIADSCGGVVDCGTAKCTGGAICGGAGVANQCGKPTCVPITTCPAGLNCGSIADGCGGAISCGGPTACTGVQICGGGGIANQCGGGGVTGPDGGGSCVPKTCAQTGLQCGPVADGCGGIATCPNCTSPQICGANNMPSICGGSAQCTPKTTAACPATNGCGFIADGCGGLVDCGGCNGTCGATTPNVCDQGACTGFCLNQVACAAGSETRIVGQVFAPNGTLPLPGALVYVPNGGPSPSYGVTAITDGITAGKCDTCDAEASGLPLVNTTADASGNFTLRNVPAGVSFPVVVQLGKWRRLFTVGSIAACQPATLDGSTPARPLPRLPVRQNEGNNGVDNIPLVAISTGSVDAMECVYLKIGVAQDQFSKGNGTGRIRMFLNTSGGTKGATYSTGAYPNADGNYTGNNGTPCAQAGSTPAAGSAACAGLYDTTAHLDKFDAVIMSCGGPPTTWAGTATAHAVQPNVVSYANSGGRVFATHYQYGWLYDNSPWGAGNGVQPTGTPPNSTATWNTDRATCGGPGSGCIWQGAISTGAPGSKLLTFHDWLPSAGVTLVGGPTANPRVVNIIEARDDVSRPVATGAEEWITYNSGTVQAGGASTTTPRSVLHYTFNTPWGDTKQCGRVLYSDFHVSVPGTGGAAFPNECTAGFNDNEKMLAFFLFDLTSCVDSGPPPPPPCTPKTCADYPATTCGPQSDGCSGQTASCNPCPNGQTCGGGGPSKCGGPTCTPKTTCPAGFDCGQAPDGCGGTVNCGVCTAGTTCGGGGVANKCGKPSCTTLTCADQGVECGQTGDGCGGLQTCPPCPAGTTCGGGGVPNKCGKPACTPATKCPAGKNCGDIPDGCGGSVHCGNCTAGQTCGGGGSPNVCGAASCDPKTCAEIGAECGAVSDQCGGVAQCPKCPGEDTGASFCNAQNFCVSQTCTPRTCAQQNITCGPTADGCGVIIQCGDCAPDEACGGGGTPGQCGKNVCAPKSCTDLGAACGQVADGCGGLTQPCGDCAGALSCKNGACVTACTPTTCDAAGAHCGSIADGCGGIVDCGPCPVGQTCGFNNQANQCGTDGPK